MGIILVLCGVPNCALFLFKKTNLARWFNILLLFFILDIKLWHEHALRRWCFNGLSEEVNFLGVRLALVYVANCCNGFAQIMNEIFDVRVIAKSLNRCEYTVGTLSFVFFNDLLLSHRKVLLNQLAEFGSQINLQGQNIDLTSQRLSKGILRQTY